MSSTGESNILSSSCDKDVGNVNDDDDKAGDGDGRKYVLCSSSSPPKHGSIYSNKKYILNIKGSIYSKNILNITGSMHYVLHRPLPNTGVSIQKIY